MWQFFLAVFCAGYYHRAEEIQRSHEVEQRHQETLKLEKQHRQEWDEIKSIAHTPIGTDEFRELMLRLNERDAQRYGH